MSKSKKSLEDILGRPSKKETKATYAMLRFDKRPDLLKFMLDRIQKLGTSKNSYLLALIELDMGGQNETK